MLVPPASVCSISSAVWGMVRVPISFPLTRAALLAVGLSRLLLEGMVTSVVLLAVPAEDGRALR